MNSELKELRDELLFIGRLVYTAAAIVILPIVLVLGVAYGLAWGVFESFIWWIEQFRRIWTDAETHR